MREECERGFGVPALIAVHSDSTELRRLMRDLYAKHQNGIITGRFFSAMMTDWDADDKSLRGGRATTVDTSFGQTAAGDVGISEQEYFDHGVLMVAMVPVCGAGPDSSMARAERR